MISTVKTFRSLKLQVSLIALAMSIAMPLIGQKPKKDDLQKPLAGPRAAALRVTWLYI